MVAIDIKTKIPEGWSQERLGSLFDIIAGQAPSSIYYNDKEQGVPFLKVNSFGSKFPQVDTWTTKSLRDSRVGDVLFSVAGSVGFVNYGIDASITRSIFALRPRNNKIGQEYLYYLMNFISPTLSNFAGGSAQKVIGKVPINKFEFQIPNLPEQQKIAEVLTMIDEVIEKTDAIIEKNKRIKQGLMQDLFRYGIDEHGNIRSEKTHKFKTVKIDNEEMRVPEEWEIKMIIEIANNEKFAIVDGPFGSNLKTEHYKSSGIPIIQSGFVTSGEFYAEKYLYVDKQKFLSEIRSKVVPGDIIMAKIGAQCGTCAILPESHPVSILAGNCLKISVGKNYSNIFLDTLLKYYYQNGRLFLIITTTAQPAVNMSALKKLQIIKPPFKEQERIIELLNLRNSSIEKERIYKQKLLSLKRGLMEDLLPGKVRVNSLIN